MNAVEQFLSAAGPFSFEPPSFHHERAVIFVVEPDKKHFLPVGAQTANLAVSALALRPAAAGSPASSAGVQLFAQVHNYSAQAQAVILAIYSQVGEQPDILRV